MKVRGAIKVVGWKVWVMMFTGCLLVVAIRCVGYESGLFLVYKD